MSRFSLSEALGLGWKIVHEDLDSLGSGAKLVAEKHLSAPGFPDTLVREVADTTGLLLERVFAYEAHLAKKGYYANRPESAPVEEPEAAPEEPAEPVTEPAAEIAPEPAPVEEPAEAPAEVLAPPAADGEQPEAQA